MVVGGLIRYATIEIRGFSAACFISAVSQFADGLDGKTFETPQVMPMHSAAESRRQKRTGIAVRAPGWSSVLGPGSGKRRMRVVLTCRWTMVEKMTGMVLCW